VELSKEEKAVVSMLLHEKDGVASFIPYILPAVLLALYGVYNKEYIACALSFFCLFGLSAWYIQFSRNYAKELKSAVQKYEALVGALNENGSQET
jgi:hypothetical protein